MVASPLTSRRSARIASRPRPPTGGVGASASRKAQEAPNLSASWTNGGINVSPGISRSTSPEQISAAAGRADERRRHADRAVQTTNGGIRVPDSRNAQAEEPDTTEPTLHELRPHGPSSQSRA